MASRPVLALDFDGVIHDYREGWQDGHIYGEPTSGFFEWALEAQEFFTLSIFSSRSGTMEGRTAMRKWLKRKEQPAELLFEFPSYKPSAFLTIDDRALTFSGDWDEFNPASLRTFKPWNKEK